MTSINNQYRNEKIVSFIIFIYIYEKIHTFTAISVPDILIGSFWERFY